MVPKIDRLIGELAHLQDQRGKVGPNHPRFQRWLAETQAYLRHRGKREEISRFEGLGVVRARPRMWRNEESSAAEFKDFRADLERVRRLLEEVRAAEAFGSQSKDRKVELPPHP